MLVEQRLATAWETKLNAVVLGRIIKGKRTVQLNFCHRCSKLLFFSLFFFLFLK